jgi:hypothetical protein
MVSVPKKVFLSYARDDLDAARDLESALVAAAIMVWRDQGGLYGGAQWPKAIGEAIASSDALLLVWSLRAARSHFVEFEWTTAMALKKAIIPCFLDETSLPPSLSAVNGIPCNDLDAVLYAITRAIESTAGQADPVRESKVIDKLRGVNSAKPENALQTAKAVFSQEGWVVGSSYTAGGNIIINQRSWKEVVLSALAAAVLVVIIVLYFTSDQKDNGKGQEGGTNIRNDNHSQSAGSSFTGFVLDQNNNPIDGASLEIKELPGQTSTITGKTTSDGDFHINNIPSKIGDRGVVVVTAPGYKSHSESIVLPGPATIKLEKAR